MRVIHFFEAMLFAPKWYHYPLIVMLLPLAFVNGIVMVVRRVLTPKKTFDTPIVSVGNLVLGGSGKTPFVIALALHYRDVTIVSRGYGRQSSGLVEVSRNGTILTCVEQSGDEPMLIAQSLPEASVIVSEERAEGITLAEKQGAKLILLDDGFNRVSINKCEILLEPETIRNHLPFPAGAFREFWFTKFCADIVAKEGEAFTREVSYENLSPRMLLVTAISQPKRLDIYLPDGVVSAVYYPNHGYFNEVELRQKMEQCGASSILVTEKDAVKMSLFRLPISLLKLRLKIDNTLFDRVDACVNI